MSRALLFTVTVVAATMLGAGRVDAQTPFHVCGIVTAYFVSDIAAGGRIEIDNKNYAIASSASFSRKQPLPDVKVGADVCVDGTVNEAGALLDFTVGPRAAPALNTAAQASSRVLTPSSSTSAGTVEPPPLLPWGLLGLAMATAALAIGFRRPVK